jgi:chitin disaccharide deacetylase
VKRLIVNGDDFGASGGVNRGVIEAHRMGILTSASLMVDGRAGADAAALAEESPSLGVGLHAVLSPDADTDSVRTDLEQQWERFVMLTGRRPTHLDSHHDVHRTASALPVFLAFAEQHAVPLRGFCGVRHIGSFYGQWAGETHLEQVGMSVLAEILATDLEEGFNELCCHPGYVDPELRSSYRHEHRAELDTLRDPALTVVIREHEIALATFSDLAAR